jgi:hypothetical protein
MYKGWVEVIVSVTNTNLAYLRRVRCKFGEICAESAVPMRMKYSALCSLILN